MFETTHFIFLILFFISSCSWVFVDCVLLLGNMFYLAIIGLKSFAFFHVYCRSDIKDIVIDGNNLVNEIFLQDNIPYLETVCDTSFLVNEVLRVLNNLENYGLRIVKIFLDTMKESEKMNSLLKRRRKNIRRINAFWESDLLLKSVLSILLLSFRRHKDIIHLS